MVSRIDNYSFYHYLAIVRDIKGRMKGPDELYMCPYQ